MSSGELTKFEERAQLCAILFNEAKNKGYSGSEENIIRAKKLVKAFHSFVCFKPNGSLTREGIKTELRKAFPELVWDVQLLPTHIRVLCTVAYNPPRVNFDGYVESQYPSLKSVCAQFPGSSYRCRKIHQSVRAVYSNESFTFLDIGIVALDLPLQSISTNGDVYISKLDILKRFISYALDNTVAKKLDNAIYWGTIAGYTSSSEDKVYLADKRKYTCPHPILSNSYFSYYAPDEVIPESKKIFLDSLIFNSIPYFGGMLTGLQR